MELKEFIIEDDWMLHKYMLYIYIFFFFLAEVSEASEHFRSLWF